MTKIVPASIRNRNPGAMYPGPSAKKFGSTGKEILRSRDGTHLIATFPSHIQGAAAMFDLLASKKYCGLTVQGAIKKWCGSFYLSTYLKVLEEKGGVKRTDKLTKEILADPEKAIPLVKAMAFQEAGREYPMTDEEWKTAHGCCFVDQIAPSFSPENDVPTPKEETRVAEAVKPYVKAGAAGGGTLGITAIAANPPDLSWMANLQGAGSTVASFGAWLTSSPWQLAAVLGIGLAVFFLPKLVGGER